MKKNIVLILVLLAIFFGCKNKEYRKKIATEDGYEIDLKLVNGYSCLIDTPNGLYEKKEGDYIYIKTEEVCSFVELCRKWSLLECNNRPATLTVYENDKFAVLILYKE